MDRREFVKKSLTATGAITALGALNLTNIGLRDTYRHVTTPRTVYTSGKNAEFPPLKIAFLSDMHVGCPSVTISSLARIIDKVNALEPDLIFLGGDFLNTAHSEYTDTLIMNGHMEPAENIGKALENLRSKYGAYAVLGNHDWYHDAPGITTALEKAGISVLENQSSALNIKGQTLWITGVGDHSTHHADIQKSFNAVAPQQPVIAMCHDPADFLQIKKLETINPVVTLSGHTHGGQICLPFIGPLGKPAGGNDIPDEYMYGHIKEFHNEEPQNLIVTSGLGTSQKAIRFGTKSEIVDLSITPAL